ncbi:maltose ABC transporter substrate-binding protein [Cutibacterium sp.]|uniref:sugar ABC transporter substrate-binding protein n=1 Tax=Cutibacterium sp. TaxID=1912221 RepID=UPI0026DBE66D|nr:maltose ABC transporter substrate-binding protein [Cutibacterium sp.]MDO4413019.1 maltose ABC transporter substrate-binding protein [Cutibacterium sp.]
MSDITRRSMLLGSLGAAAVGLLSACGGNDEPAANSSASSQAPAAAGSILVWTDSNREPVLRTVAEQFKKDTGVTVKLAVKDFAKIPDDFITQVPTGKGPDAVITAHDSTGRMVQNGVVAPLELGDTSAYQDVAIEAFTVDGKIYGVPYATENIALVRNTKFVKDAPKTFDEMIDMGKKSGAKYPFLVGLDPKQSDPYHLYPFQASFGAPVFELTDNGFDSSKVAMGGTNGEKFAVWLAEQGKAKNLNLNVSQDISKDLFGKGQAAFILTGPWSLDGFKKAGITYEISEVPSAGGQPATPLVGVQGFWMSAKTKNAVATQKFLVEYIGNPDVQTELYKVGNRPPANKEAFEKAKSDKDVAAFGAVGQKAIPMPNIPAMGSVWTDWGVAQAEIINGKASDPKATWNKAVNSINDKIKKG